MCLPVFVFRRTRLSCISLPIWGSLPEIVSPIVICPTGRGKVKRWRLEGFVGKIRFGLWGAALLAALPVQAQTPPENVVRELVAVGAIPGAVAGRVTAETLTFAVGGERVARSEDPVQSGDAWQVGSVAKSMAAVLAARGYVEQDKKRNAVRVINKAWLVRPHPDLAAAFAAIEPEESPRQRLKRFGKLLKVHPDNRETRLLEADLNLAAEDFPAARRALGTLADSVSISPAAKGISSTETQANQRTGGVCSFCGSKSKAVQPSGAVSMRPSRR